MLSDPRAHLCAGAVSEPRYPPGDPHPGDSPRKLAGVRGTARHRLGEPAPRNAAGNRGSPGSRPPPGDVTGFRLARTYGPQVTVNGDAHARCSTCAMLIAPFRHLTRGFFAGRETEVATLAAYVDGPDVDAQGVAPPPNFIYGPGGMGKSAPLAHFILCIRNAIPLCTDSWRPFVYLDFDRPELDRAIFLACCWRLHGKSGRRCLRSRETSMTCSPHWTVVARAASESNNVAAEPAERLYGPPSQATSMNSWARWRIFSMRSTVFCLRRWCL